MADYTFYGRAHLSSDAVRVSGENQYAMGSNASSLGIKGSEQLASGVQAVWKLESEFDFTGENTSINARNRYLGIVTSYGTLVGGYQDSPLRALGSKVDYLEGTIADRRSIMGSVRSQYDPITTDVYNLRARRSLMFVSQRIAGLQLRAMLALREFGHFKTKSSGPLKSEAITSYSAVYKTRFLYLGASYEKHEVWENTDIIRYAGGVVFDSVDINVIYDKMYSELRSVFYRDSYGASIRLRIFDTALIVQSFYAEQDFHNENSEGLLVAAGITQKMSRDVSLYLLGAWVNNSELGSYTLGAAEHGEKFAPVANGQNLYGVSMGMTYTF